MCTDHRSEAFPRRDFLRKGVIGGTIAGLGLSASQARAAVGPRTSLSTAQALEKLKQGNRRYVENAELCATELTRRRQQVAGSQAPWATIVSCSDSRVPPELVFGGLGPGELFVVRNAGNLVDDQELGSVEYGAAVLGTPLVMILGHQRCGAVSAACEIVLKNASFPGFIGPMVQPIVPAARAMRGASGDFVTNAVKESAKRTAHHLVSRSSVLARLAGDHKVVIVPAYYALDSGRVEFEI